MSQYFTMLARTVEPNSQRPLFLRLQSGSQTLHFSRSHRLWYLSLVQLPVLSSVNISRSLHLFLYLVKLVAFRRQTLSVDDNHSTVQHLAIQFDALYQILKWSISYTHLTRLLLCKWSCTSQSWHQSRVRGLTRSSSLTNPISISNTVPTWSMAQLSAHLARAGLISVRISRSEIAGIFLFHMAANDKATVRNPNDSACTVV